jgi:hypothetical protein
MPKTKISEYSTTNSANTDIESINIDEGCAPSGINNAIRELMVHLKEFQTGSSGDPLTVAGTFVASGGATLSGTNTLSGSTVMTASAGTSASPSIHFSSDTNTGIFSPAADTIAFAEGGAEVARFNSSGFLGLGYTDPRGRLYVGTADLSSGSTDASNGINLKQTSTTAATGIYLERSGERKGYYIYLGGDADSLTFQRNNNGTKADTMSLDRDGNVGIGTTTAVGKTTIRNSAIDQVALTLTHDSVSALNWNFVSGVSGEAHEVFELRSGTNKWLRLFGVSGANHAAFYTANTERARIDSSGNLLLGQTSTSSGADGKLSATAASGSNQCAATFKNFEGASQYTTITYNAATSGDNLFTAFGTETSFTVRGSISYNRAGGLVAYNVTSDYRAKDIYGPVVGSGALIDSVPVYMGKMKDATQERPMFIAHEVPTYAHTGEKDAVDKDGKPVYQQMDASALIPVMWAEIQDLRKRLAAAGI